MNRTTSIFVLFTALACTGIAYSQPVVEINNQTYSSGQIVSTRASSTVFTKNTVLVSTGATVSYQAGESITLNPGFSVQAGGIFQARISTNKAQFIKQIVPARLAPGETAAASVTMRNIGSQPWTTVGNFKLGSQATENNTLWTGSNRVVMSTSPITTGQDQTFTFNITAPVTEGTYSFQWLMIQEGVEWFGEPSALFTVRVGPYVVTDDDDGLPASYTTDTTGTGVPDSVKTALGLNVSTPASSVPGTQQGYQYDELQRLTDGPGRTYNQDQENNIVSP